MGDTQLWTFYSKIPSSHSKAMRSQIELKREVVRLKREMNSTSSQDEFAKWAKLRRQHDKALAQYDETCTLPYRSYIALIRKELHLHYIPESKPLI